MTWRMILPALLLSSLMAPAQSGWMLGDNITSAGWPTCGEVDIMENIGKEPSTVHGTVHGPGYSGGSGISAQYVLPNGQKFSDDFHVFEAIWTPDSVEFLVDSKSY